VAVIVTGGAGFIGSHLTEGLAARGEDVVVLDDLSSGKRENVPDGIELVERDIREGMSDVFGRVQPSVCYHLAAQMDVRVSVAQPDHDAAINVLGTVKVLEAALEQGTKIVFSSTGGAIYGECDGPAPETQERLPISPYGISKLAGEEYLAGWNRLFAAGHVSLRFANVYGPRQEPTLEGGVIAIFLDRLAAGEPTRIFGDGRQTRDFVYVGDVVRAVLAAVDHGGGVLNVGTGIETSVGDLHALCARVAGVEQEPELAPERPGDVRRSVIDPGRAERELGWRAELTLEEGLRATWDWVRSAAAA
jgi:UDP-glucose 4-epimerase